MFTRHLLAATGLLLPLVASAAGGSGTSSDPFLIDNCTELSAMRNNLSAFYALTTDIPCTGEWVPVGTDAAPFTGQLNGQFFTISGLSSTSSLATVGLFGTMNLAYVENLSITGAQFTATNGGSVGALMGRSIHTYITRINIDADVSSPTGIAGAVVGEMDHGTYVRVNVTGTVNGHDAGGFLGTAVSDDTNQNSAQVSCFQCWTSADVTGVARAGGFAAYMEVMGVADSAATGSASANLVGGFAAETRRFHIRESYSWATVSGPNKAAFIAGPIGDTKVTHIYALGSDGTDIDGLYLYFDFESEPGAYTEIESLYISHADQQSGAASIYYDSATSPFDQWDFLNLWVDSSGDANPTFPVLRQQPQPAATVDIDCDQGSPFDWDGDGDDDGCRGVNVVIDPSVTMPAGSRLGDDITVGAHATVGLNVVIGSGSVVATRAVVGDDNTFGNNVVIGRSSVLGRGNTLGDDTVLGRAVTMGDDNDIGAMSSIGYDAVIGNNVTATGILIVGNLAQLGYAGGAGPIMLTGDIVIARSAQLATTLGATLTAGDGVVVGPDTVIGSGSDLGANVRIRKQASLAVNTVIGDGARIGRGVMTSDGVSIDANANVSAGVELCDATTAFGGHIPRSFADPACL